MGKGTDIVNDINKKYVKISNRVTSAYEKHLALPCDLYFPIYPSYNETTAYRDMKIFSPHQSPTYSKEPDVRKAMFYIPFLIKKDNYNSSEYEFDSYYIHKNIFILCIIQIDKNMHIWYDDIDNGKFRLFLMLPGQIFRS